MKLPLAHTGEHALQAHLQAVATMSAGFSADLAPTGQTAQWAYLAGLWHDLGKYRPGFQRYLKASENPDAHISTRLVAKRVGADVRPLRVPSTQWVEAGVDIDSPVVFRALAGLDATAQAARRCNTQGRLSGRGTVVVFVPPTQPMQGPLLKAASRYPCPVFTCN